MTIKRQWMLVLIISVIISIAINSLVFGSLINKYFVDYTTVNYNNHFNQIVEFSRKALIEKNFTSQQLEVQLEAHLSDPIIRIKLYDANGQLQADVSSETGRTMGMMGKGMMNRMMGAQSYETDSAELTDTGAVIGRINITRYSSFGNSMATRMFKTALLRNSILSFFMVLIFVFIVGAWISKKMSRDLMNTASLALNIDLGNKTNIKPSKVREIRIIQQSLETLQSRLKLKQTSRKRLLDELVHQTRTPLTILKTHLEGFEDGIISMTSEEIKTCEAQIENITSIISNMSGMLDAEKDIDSIKPMEFELSQLLRQILGGLKVQFDKKNINLSLLTNQKIVVKSDKYKLSQCIYNIITNAYKFTDPNGYVSVAYKTEGEEVSIVIEDSGKGITEDDMKHLFEAYFRGSNSNNISGEGIGLYVVKENLDKINGAISVESEHGKGSRFIIKFPKTIENNTEHRDFGENSIPTEIDKGNSHL